MLRYPLRCCWGDYVYRAREIDHDEFTYRDNQLRQQQLYFRVTVQLVVVRTSAGIRRAVVGIVRKLRPERHSMMQSWQLPMLRMKLLMLLVWR